MNCKEMLDKVVKIIARTDVDRELALLFMNSARRAVFRANSIRKFHGYRTVTHTSGIISDLTIKHAKTIEYNDGTTTKTLLKIKNFDTARDLYTDFTATGAPVHYLDVGTVIWILPVPTAGTIKIYGEFWPSDLTDSTESVDVTTVELPEAFIYLTAAEYWDYFDENKKGDFWRQKGNVIVDAYLKQDRKLATYGVGLTSDPLGNGGV
ncbi:MAG: hypothetical protein AAGU23_00535 [Bacillota bacterium]